MDSFYKFVGTKPDALAMGWSESVPKTDVVMSYLYCRLHEEVFNDEVLFAQSYRDDGLVILAGDENFWTEKFPDWSKNIRQKILDFSLGNYEIEIDFSFETINFLDLQISKKLDGGCIYSIYKKPEQNLVYLNKDSMHPPKVLKAIPNGVLNRLYHRVIR